MTITDIVTLVLSAFLIYRGASRGFLGSLVGPLALIFASVVSFAYFLWTTNLIVSLCIGLFGPILLAWVFRFFLRSWNQMTNPDGNVSLPSRIGGAFLTWSWGMVMWIIALLLLVLIPPMNKPLQIAYKDIHLSYTYKIIKPFDLSAQDDQATTQEDIQTLSEDKRIQDIINDPQIIEAAKNRDYTTLMAHPKIIAITQDPALLKKMFSIYKQMKTDETMTK